MRNMSSLRHAFAPGGALIVLLCAADARADSIEDFYKSKTVTIVTSTGVGGPFDMTARALAKHMPKYLPGRPTMIVRNMTGGSNLFTWVWHSAGFKSMDDVMRRELITGSTGVGSGTFIYPNAMNMILGTRHRI